MRIAVSAAAFLGISLFLAIRYRDSLVQTMPATLISIGLVLYGLAFFRRLHWITPILACCLAALCLLLGREMKRRGVRDALRIVCMPLREPQFWINTAVLAAIFVLVGYRQVLEWDAYNFWGADIKSLFYRNGFAERGSNVAASFGDYPPYTQLLIWWVLHIFGRCDEGLMFGGYFLYSAMVLFGTTDRLHLKRFSHKLAAGIGSTALLFALPSVVDTSWYRALYVDPVMGILWGALLCAFALEHTCSEGFHFYKCAVLLMALTLTKTIGFLWAGYAVVFYLVWNGVSKKSLGRGGILAAAAAVVYASWRIYCGLLQRTTYLTGGIVPGVKDRLGEILNGTFFSSGNNLAYIKSYVKAFLFAPAHRASTGAVDLTPVLVVLLILALFSAFRLARWIERRRFVRLLGFGFCIYALTYSVLLSGHLTIFYNETQYLAPENMLTQMTRYGAPMNIGFLVLALAICMDRFRLPEGKRSAGRAAAVIPGLAALAVFLCAGYPTMADCLIRGHDPLNPQRIEKRAVFAESYDEFLTALSQVPVAGENRRVLLLLSSADFNPIVTFLASPISIQTAYYSESVTVESLREMAGRVGASWIYVQDGSPEQIERLEQLIPDFRIHTLYTVP